MTTLSAICLAIISVVPHPISPITPLPSKAQIRWQQMETNAFVHFGPNTFTDVEWGGGKEDPNLFNPTDLDCDQWVRAFKAAGIKGVIITAKHHDGFCLWPSKLSTHTVAQSKWMGGKGDVLKSLSEACQRGGLKFGVYLSPWDRNHPAYGTPEYNKVFVSMLKEVLTHYGPVFEVWFDGANGEGPNGKRQVYDWPLFNATVKKYQPNAVIFSDAGPDVRWVGNEDGLASETSWSMVPGGRYVPGTPLASELGEGSENGDTWVTPECDVSIRPGWFFHAHETDKVKTPAYLLDLYEKSVGRNSLLLLNVPPDWRGHLADADVNALAGFRHLVNQVYAKNLAAGATISASSELEQTDAQSLLKKRGLWSARQADSEPAVTITLKKATEFNRVVLAEPIQFGQRVKSFTVQAQLADGTWKTITSRTTIGHRRILPVETTTATRVKITVTASRACPALTLIGLYLR